jgi:hypothetical protein
MPEPPKTAGITAGGNSICTAKNGILSTHAGSIYSGMPSSPATNPKYFNPSVAAKEQKAAKDKEVSYSFIFLTFVVV